MATNRYITQGKRNERNLIEDLYSETVAIYGQDMYYLPRSQVTKDTFFGDDISSTFNHRYCIEMYIETFSGYDGEGDIASKFGVEIRDRVELTFTRKRWEQTIAKFDPEINGGRPREGDLVWIELSKSMFEITKVEHENPFYQLSHQNVYRLICEKYEYNEDDFETDDYEIDKIDMEDAYGFKYTIEMVYGNDFIPGETVHQNLDGGIILKAEVASYDPDTKIIELIHVGSNTNDFHKFTLGQVYNTTGSRECNLISIVGEESGNISDPDNDDFSTGISNILDFSETNPFGMPRSS